jgi:hypothetical protein
MRAKKAAAGGAGTWAALIQPDGWVAFNIADGGLASRAPEKFLATVCEWE